MSSRHFILSISCHKWVVGLGKIGNLAISYLNYPKSAFLGNYIWVLD